MTDINGDFEVNGESRGTTPDGFRTVLKSLDPAYFGFVMSTGIVAIAFLELGVDAVAWPLSTFNVSCYLLLIGLFGARSLVFPERIVAELRDGERHWGTLTFVVATNTVGTQFVVFFDQPVIATGLWLLAVVTTPLLLYYLFVIEFIGAAETDVSERIDGAFLLVIVCMQSLAILGGLLSISQTGYTDVTVLLSLGYFGAGYVLYFVVVTVVMYRLLDGALEPADWTGPYWITMGAAAITTLAGGTLGPRLDSLSAWEPYAPVVLGVTFLAWAIASWWIPLLLAVDIWKFTTEDVDGRTPAWIMLFPWSRLGIGRQLHTYVPTAWGRVFPMGMYTAATINLAGIGAFSLLSVIPTYWGWFSLIVWGVTFIGACRAAVRAVQTTV